VESTCGCKRLASIGPPQRCHRVPPKYSVRVPILLGKLHLGGIPRNACTESRRLITRRSQVQILPPLLERPRKRGLFYPSGKASSRRFCPTFARSLRMGRACGDDPVHGKEGVGGSSPPEGSAKAAQIAAFPVEGACRSSGMRWVWISLWSFRSKRPLRTPRIRTRSRRLDEAALERHAD